MTYLLYLAIPVGIGAGLWAVSLEEIGFSLRVGLHALAFFLSYGPFFLGRYWHTKHPKWAMVAYLSANALRIMGCFCVILFFQAYDSSLEIVALEIYVISIASFLIFQLVNLSFSRRNGRIQP